MSDDSPLFVSALELLAHATELYTQGEERKYKFVVLHLANALELILKDRLIDQGISIYLPGQSRTIDIWKTFEELQKVGIEVPERPVIELLVDDRNNIQHRFGFPDADTVYFYLRHVVAFFSRFLNEEYGVALAGALGLYLSQNDLALLGLVESKDEEYSFLDELFGLSPEAAVMQAYSLLESKFSSVLGPHATSTTRPHLLSGNPDFLDLLSDLAVDGFISSSTIEGYYNLTEMRNRAAHGQVLDVPTDSWAETLGFAKDMLTGFDRATEAGFFTQWRPQKDSEDSDTDAE